MTPLEITSDDRLALEYEQMRTRALSTGCILSGIDRALISGGVYQWALAVENSKTRVHIVPKLDSLGSEIAPNEASQIDRGVINLIASMAIESIRADLGAA